MENKIMKKTLFFIVIIMFSVLATAAEVKVKEASVKDVDGVTAATMKTGEKEKTPEELVEG